MTTKRAGVGVDLSGWGSPQTGSVEEGLRKVERGLAMAIKIGAKEQVQDAHREMAELYAAQVTIGERF